MQLFNLKVYNVYINPFSVEKSFCCIVDFHAFANLSHLTHYDGKEGTYDNYIVAVILTNFYRSLK